MKNTATARARVRVLVEIEDPGCFNVGISLHEIFATAKAYATNTVAAAIPNARIVGQPEVTVTLVEDDQ